MTRLQELLLSRKIVVVVGSGGVGKTTTSALFALHAAIEGKRVLVMTIDPARRLANALGVEGLDHEVMEIDLAKFADFDVQPKGRLFATMLDMKSAFDSIIERNVPNPADRKAINENRFYRFFSTSLAGAQELSATDRLLDVANSGEYDLVVLDTPPTTNALDFLDAPKRFADALDNETIRWFIEAGSKAARSTNFMNVGAGMIIKTLGRFTGMDFFRELGDFLMHLNKVLVGFQERSQHTTQLLSDDSTFVIVSSPDPATVREAQFFRQRLRDFNVHFGAMVVNRVRQLLPDDAPIDVPVEALTDRLMEYPSSGLFSRPLTQRLAASLQTNAKNFQSLAEIDDRTIAQLEKEFGDSVEIRRIPMYATDIHSLDGLERVRRDLFGLESFDELSARLAKG